MARLERLRLALAAAPVAQPCTAEAVGALYTSAYATARQVAPAERLLLPPQELEEACVQEQVPPACVPVLVWLADGLCDELPPAATKQAYELACILLGVVYRQLPWSIQRQLWGGPTAAATVKMVADSLLRQLGPREVFFHQLVQVLTALLGATYPCPDAGASASTSTSSTTPGGSSSSNSSSRPGVSLQQVAAVALAWEQVCGLLTSFALASEPGAVVTSLKATGLLQLLLEGTLLLLGTAPEVPPTTDQEQLYYWDAMRSVATASSYMTMALGMTVYNVWHITHTRTLPGGAPLPPGLLWDAEPPSSLFEAWMPPMLKLQLLHLAKMQWDLRQGPAAASASPEDDSEQARDSKALERAVPRMASPCVAGELLQQRAPGLLPHTRRCKRQVPNRNGSGRRREVVEETLIKLSQTHLVNCLAAVSYYQRACQHDGRVFSPLDAQDLALLLEATELYCLVCPSDANGTVVDNITAAYTTMLLNPYPVLASFAATCGEVVISIAEYLVEDVLLVASSGAALQAASTTAASSNSATRSSSSSSSSSRARPRAGGGNPSLTLERRVAWAHDVLELLAGFMTMQALPKPPDGGSYWEAAGYGAGVLHGLLTSSTAPRLLRLMEACYRVPQLLDPPVIDLLNVLPAALPALHVAASSPKGSRALLSAITTAVKGQQVANCIIEQLVKAGGELVPAAIEVRGAVPGPVGAKLAQRLAKQREVAVASAVDDGLSMVRLASKLFTRAAGLVDPQLAPLAAYLAARKLPPGQKSKPWAVEAAVLMDLCPSSDSEGAYGYSRHLVRCPAQVAGINRALAQALAAQHAAAARQQAAKLSQAGGGAAEAEQLCQQLQGLWLGRDQGVLAGLSHTERQALMVGQMPPAGSTTNAVPAGNSSRRSSGSGSGSATLDVSDIPQLLQTYGIPQEEVAAAGNPAEWASGLGPASEQDLRVAATALLAACKAAGAGAQLPLLVREAQPLLEQQAWCQELARGPWGQKLLGSDILTDFVDVAIWALLLAPALALLLPAQQAAQLHSLADGAMDSVESLENVLTGEKVMQLLGLLGQVVAPGAPGCSYPGCCNLEGRSEAELPLQVCTRCRGVRYCCREHQMTHWKSGHKEACQAAAGAAQAAVKQVRHTASS